MQLLLLLLLLSLSFVGPLSAQSPRGNRDDLNEPTPTIQVDPEVDSLLVRADQLAARREYDLAATLWQKLLDESGHHLLTADGERYAPLREHVFRKLAALPPSARQVYRITADGDARALLDGATGDAAEREVALAETVRRFFVSSLGDDAAFELAGLALDRRDFVTASRLTRAILQNHPDPSVPLGQVLLRQAVADGYLGDRKASEAALDRLAKLPAAGPTAAEIATIRAYLQREVYPRRGVASTRGADRSVLTSIVQLGPQPNLPRGAIAGPLTEHLEHEWPVPDSAAVELLPGGGVMPMHIHRAMSYLRATMPDFSIIVSDLEFDASPIFGSVTIEYPSGPMATLDSIVWDASTFYGRGGASPSGALTDDERRATMVARWRERRWHPASQLIALPGRLAFRGIDEVTVWETESGRLRQRWESPWRNGKSQEAATNAGGYVAGQPGGSAESALFGDRLPLAMSAVDDVLYVIEESRLPRETGDQSDVAPQPNEKPEPTKEVPEPGDPRIIIEAEEEPAGMEPGMPQPTAQNEGRQRKNFLTAYELRTGHLRWRRAAADGAAIIRDAKMPDTGGDDAGFVGPPVAWADRLLVPVLSGGQFSLLAVSAEDGSTLWKTPLGDEPDAGSNPGAASCVAIAGGDAYVVLGTGMVYAVDARSGAVHWGTRYARDGAPAMVQQNPGFGPMQQIKSSAWAGWETDVAIVSGNTLVILASDHDGLLALDRRTGELRWRSPRRLPSGTAVRYCLGVIDRRLYVAGPDVVRAYDLPSGRLDWEQQFRPTTGRGALTTQAIYLPIYGAVDGAVLTLDSVTGRELGQSAVTLARSEPLGNLYSDGERLWVAGANRIYALTHVPHQLQELGRGMDQRQPEAAWKRARLLARLKRYDEALADVRRAHEWQASIDPIAAADAALDTLTEGRFAHVNPLATLRFIADRDGLVPANGPAELFRSRDRLVRSALGAIQRRPTAQAMSVVVETVTKFLGPNVSEDIDHQRILNAAALAIDRSATVADLAVLRDVVMNDSNPVRRLAAMPAFVRHGEPGDREFVATLLQSDDPQVRLAAAESLVAVAGRTAGLATLVDLSNSDILATRRRALRGLRLAAGESAPPAVLDATAAERMQQSAAWRKWIESCGEQLTLPLPGAMGGGWFDRILVTSDTPGRVVEFDVHGREVWQHDKLPLPLACAGTPEGHRLILIRGGRQIVEFDALGTEIWRSAILPWMVSSVERLPDGNTRVACQQRDSIVEIAPDGYIVSTTVVRGGPASTQQVAADRTLVALAGGGRVVEVLPNGEVVWEAAEWPQVRSAQRLASGQTLVVQTTTGALTLLNRSGQSSIWQRAGIKELVQAARGLDGTTVLADQKHLEMLGADGKSLWTQARTLITGLAAY